MRPKITGVLLLVVMKSKVVSRVDVGYGPRRTTGLLGTHFRSTLGSWGPLQDHLGLHFRSTLGSWGTPTGPPGASEDPLQDHLGLLGTHCRTTWGF